MTSLIHISVTFTRMCVKAISLSKQCVHVQHHTKPFICVFTVIDEHATSPNVLQVIVNLVSPLVQHSLCADVYRGLPPGPALLPQVIPHRWTYNRVVMHDLKSEIGAEALDIYIQIDIKIEPMITKVLFGPNFATSAKLFKSLMCQSICSSFSMQDIDF